MNEHTDPKKQLDVVAVDASQVPATKKPPNYWKQFRKLLEGADDILQHCERLRQISDLLEARKVGQRPPLHVRHDLLPEWLEETIVLVRRRSTISR